MPDLYDLARESVATLFSDVVSADRFKKWRAGVKEGVADKLSQYAFGEIFWKKSLGHPNTMKLSEAVTVEAWSIEEKNVGPPDGAQIWKPFRSPHYPSWWDGKYNGEYWRVSYMVPNLTVGLSVDGNPEHYTKTYIAPQLKFDIPWNVPGGRFGRGNIGFRTLEPPYVVFVKKEESVHFSFEVVLKSLFISP
jgi:hypothetical protein